MVRGNGGRWQHPAILSSFARAHYRRRAILPAALAQDDTSPAFAFTSAFCFLLSAFCLLRCLNYGVSNSQAIFLNARSVRSTICWMSFFAWAEEKKAASNCEGGR
jgi:hypothetical protein